MMMSDSVKEEHFFLKWNNFHTNLLTGFCSLLEEEYLVDVTIAVEGRFVQAHKIVLSICSPYFKEIFKENPCNHPVVVLKDVGYNEMHGLLQFMYRGEVNISQDQLPDFLRVAELLHIKGLTGTASKEQKFQSIVKEPVSQKEYIPSKRKKLIDLPSPPIGSVTKSNDLKNNSIEEAKVTSRMNMETKVRIPFERNSSSHQRKSFKSELVELREYGKQYSSKPPISMKKSGFQVTSRGRLQLVQNGFVYHCNRQTEEKIFWKCAEYNRTRCRSRCISIGDMITVTHPDHNHTASRNFGSLLPLTTFQSQ